MGDSIRKFGEQGVIHLHTEVLVNVELSKHQVLSILFFFQIRQGMTLNATEVVAISRK